MAKPPPAMSQLALLASQYDTAWKIALELFFEPFVALCFPPLYARIDWRVTPRFLDKELARIAPEHIQGSCWVDKLVQVRLKDGAAEWLLVHVEVQAQPDRQFALRMWVYHYRIWDRYRRPVVSLAVLADDDPNWRPAAHHTELAGCVEHFEFPVFKVLDFRDPEGEFERTGNVFALVVAAHQLALKTRQDPAARAEGRFGVVKYLYKRGLKREQVVNLFRLIEWLTLLPKDLELKFQEKLAEYEQVEATMTAETLLAPIELIALERGREEGQREGRQEGRQEGLVRGALIGRIQTCQELLGLAAAPAEELALQDIAVLQATRRELEAQLRARTGQQSAP